MTTRLNNPDFMKFPLEINSNGALTSSRRQHIREQIEQVLFTSPSERWFSSGIRYRGAHPGV